LVASLAVHKPKLMQSVMPSQLLLADTAEGDSPMERFKKQIGKLLGESFVTTAKLNAQIDQIEELHCEKFQGRTRYER
jgi:hypothetical protein